MRITIFGDEQLFMPVFLPKQHQKVIKIVRTHRPAQFVGRHAVNRFAVVIPNIQTLVVFGKSDVVMVNSQENDGLVENNQVLLIIRWVFSREFKEKGRIGSAYGGVEKHTVT